MRTRKTHDEEVKVRRSEADELIGNDCWWDMEEPEDAAACLQTHVDRLENQDRVRVNAYRRLNGLYESKWVAWPGSGADGFDGFGRLLGEGSDLDLNHARRAVDFVHARCSAETPAVRAEGHGADLDQHNRAEELTKFIEGLRKALSFDTVLPASLLSALKLGDGCVKVVTDGGQLGVQVCSPREFFVSRADGRHGSPRSLYQRRVEDRRTLMAQHQEHASEVWEAPSADMRHVSENYVPTAYGGSSTQDDQDSVDVTYAWHLPWMAGTEDERPGRYIKVVGSTVLEDREWTVPRFPVSFLRFTPTDPGSGHWTTGLTSILMGVQVSIYDHASHMAEAFQHSNLKIFATTPDGKAVPDYVTNPEMGTWITLPLGTTVNPQVWDPVSRQEVEHLHWLVDQLYQLAGMSQDNAKGGTPAGMDSGRAQLINFNINSTNWVDLIKRYSAHAVEVVDRLLDAAKMLATDDREVKVRYAKGSVTDVIDWADVDMERDKFVIELEEVSSAADTPAGRLQQLEQDVASKVLPPEQLAYARQDPDGWWERSQTAKSDIDFIRWMIRQCKRLDQPLPRVIEQMNRPMAIDMFRREIQAAIVGGLPGDVVDRLDRVSNEVVQAEDRAQALKAPAPGGQQQQSQQAPAVTPSGMNTF